MLKVVCHLPLLDRKEYLPMWGHVINAKISVSLYYYGEMNMWLAIFNGDKNE